MANPVRIDAHVSEVLLCAPGVYVVVFESEHRFPNFRAGQFLHLTVDDFDPSAGFWPESRVFSIASRPGSDKVAILYSVKGRYTRKMEQYLAPGKKVWLKFPYGDFVIEGAMKEGRNVALIAGGTGVSPFIPFLEINNENRWTIETHVHLAYGVRNTKHLVFPEVYSNALEYPNVFTMSVFLEESDGALPFPCPRPVPGVLAVAEIVKRLPVEHDWVFFLSGPPSMIAKLREDLLVKGIRPNDIKVDEW